MAYLLVLSLCHFNELRQLASIALCWTVYVPISTTRAVFVGFWLVFPPCLCSKRVHIKIFTQRVACAALGFLLCSMVLGSVTLTPCIVQRIENLTYPKCFEIFRWLLGAKHKEKLFQIQILLTTSSSPQMACARSWESANCQHVFLLKRIC